MFVQIVEGWISWRSCLLRFSYFRFELDPDTHPHDHCLWEHFNGEDSYHLYFTEFSCLHSWPCSPRLKKKEYEKLLYSLGGDSPTSALFTSRKALFCDRINKISKTELVESGTPSSPPLSAGGPNHPTISGFRSHCAHADLKLMILTFSKKKRLDAVSGSAGLKFNATRSFKCIRGHFPRIMWLVYIV